jgi:hypothetical protein
MPPTISTIAALNTAIVNDDAITVPGTVTIALSGSIALGSTALDAINLHSGVTLDIVGNSATPDGGTTKRGLFVYAGAATVENLTITNMLAQGGAGAGGGGGTAAWAAVCSSAATSPAMQATSP